VTHGAVAMWVIEVCCAKSGEIEIDQTCIMLLGGGSNGKSLLSLSALLGLRGVFSVPMIIL
jgi:hypothetical protein